MGGNALEAGVCDDETGLCGRSLWAICLLGILLVGLACEVRAQQLAPFPPPPSPVPAPAVPLGPAGRAAAAASGRALGVVRDTLPPIPGELLPRRDDLGGPPGMPEPGGRPIPGSLFNPGASGPGISNIRSGTFLGGSLNPASGWPFVWLDHFRPRPERLRNFWIVNTRDCPQVMGTDPWPCLQVLHFNDRGELEEREPAELLAQTVGHPVFIQVQGSLATAEMALGGLLWTHSWLGRNRALPSDAVMVAFDWPSERVFRVDIRDVNEKGRRSYVAGYHLALFLQAFPPESRICLLGQSYGGRIVTTALHLLAGGAINSQDHDPPVALPSCRTDLKIRAVLLGAAMDHDWFRPGKRLDRALYGCEMLINLYNRRDEALLLYPLLSQSGHKGAMGRRGLTSQDLEKLGPLAARYFEQDVHDILRLEHSLLDAVANPEIAQAIAPFVWATDPGPPAP